MADNPSYQIKDWPRHFENHDSRRLNQTRWVPFPNKHDGKSYRRLMARPNGICIFGAWVLIVEVASKMPIRGLLVDHDGDPLTVEDICAKTGCPVEIMEEALLVLSEPKIGWIVQVSASSFPQSTAAAEGNQKGIELKGTETERPPLTKPRRSTPEIEPPFQSEAFLHALATYKASRARTFKTESELLLYEDLREWGEAESIIALRGAAKAGHLQVLHPDKYRNNGNGKTNYSGKQSAGATGSEIDDSIWDRAERR